MIDYQFLRSRQNDMGVKELFVAITATPDTFRFKNPYKMADHGSSGNGLNLAEEHMEYKEMHTVLSEAVAAFAHLYANGVSKCTFLVGQPGGPIHILEDLECPPPVSFNHKRWYTSLCHKFPKIAFAT